MSATPDSGRFLHRSIAFANGSVSHDLAIETANPLNYHHALSDPTSLPRLSIDGKLFLPPTDSDRPRRLKAVIVVPGSLGVARSHLQHAEDLTDLGIAALVIDPFGAREIVSTVANQVQYSFAASAFDVLAALKALAGLPEIDAANIGAQGHSRGGTAVLTAATSRFANAVLGEAPPLRAVYAAYPWSGHQFLDPSIGTTVVRAVIGDRDEWCLPQQVQGHVQAMRVAGGHASLRIFAGAHHSFDRESPIEEITEASVSPGGPTAFIADDGAFLHPLGGEPDPSLVDRDLMVYALKSGYGRKGARIGSTEDQAAAFRRDMKDFWRRELLAAA